MADLNDFNKPDPTSNYLNEVLDTLRGHIQRAFKWDGSGTANGFAGMIRGAFTSVTGGLALRLYRRNATNTGEDEIISLPSVKLASAQVTDALGYTPYNSSNPSGFITSAGSISGTAAYANNIESTQPSLGYSGSGLNIDYVGQGGPQVRAQGGGAAMFSLHRPGAYAINFGLGTDNQLRTGGWSRGGNFVILDSGNYNSYAPTLTGGNASGTWPINITGNANYANSAGNGITPTSGSAPYYGARAWVNFNGTGTVAIRASGNVSSITDNGVGDYTVNFTTAMPDTNYIVAGSVSSMNNTNPYPTSVRPGVMATTSIRISTNTNVDASSILNDNTLNCVAIFR